MGAAIVHLKADLNNLRKQEEEFRTAFLKAKEEDSALAADLDTLNAEREAAREKRNSLYSEMNKVKRAQYASSGEYFKGYRRIVEQVRKLAKAGDLEAALAMCRDQMEKIHAKLNTDDAYRTEYVHAMEMQNPRKRLTAAEAEVDAELAELQDRATKGDPIARREASALQQKRSREAAREAARNAVEEAKAEAKAKLEADRKCQGRIRNESRREEEERREAERQEEEAKEEARKREEAAKQFQEESRAKAKKTGSSSAASAAMDQLLKPIDVEALPLEKFVLPSHLSSSGPSTSTSGGAVPMAAIAEQTSEAIAQEQERMRQVSAASARDKRVAAVEKKKARQTREAEEVEARRAKNAEKNKRKKLAKAASRDNVAAATAEEPEAASQRVEQPPAPTSDEAAVDGAAAADGGAAEAGPSSESPEQAATADSAPFREGQGSSRHEG